LNGDILQSTPTPNLSGKQVVQKSKFSLTLYKLEPKTHLEEILQQNPKMLARFLRVALKGIAYAADHLEEAVEIVLQYAGPETDPAHMRFMLETELADAQNAQGYGWQALADMLAKYEALPAVDVTQAFTTRVLEAARL
jgi:ABC-type nitrate/sulfonate/bicarbonate transport system substrate-binding protein